MSDQPPSGPAEPVPPASSDVPPADPPGADVPPADPPGAAAPDGPGQPGPAYPIDPATGAPASWGWPPAGGYPGHPMPGQPYAWYPAPGGWQPDDPLVTPPHAGVGGWFSRCAGALRRGWRLLLPIVVLTQVVPSAAVSVLGLVLTPAGQPTTGADGALALPPGYLRDVLVLYAAVLGVSLLLGPLQNLGWAAGTWVIARQAAGEPVGFGAALRYGARRALGLWGWSLLGSLLIAVGVCFCVLPGLYAAFALALLGPVWLFERQNPIGRSWRIFHQRFGTVLGRLALVAAAVVGGGLVGFLLETLGQLPFGAHPMESAGGAVGVTAVAVLAAVLVAPVYLAQLIGLVVTYAEQRAYEGPVDAARLAGELG